MSSESSDLRREKTAHVIVLIFSLLVDRKFLQGGVDVQLVGLQLPQERFSLNTQNNSAMPKVTSADAWNTFLK